MTDSPTMNRIERAPIIRETTYSDGTKRVERVERFDRGVLVNYWDDCLELSLNAFGCAYCFTLGARLASG